MTEDFRSYFRDPVLLATGTGTGTGKDHDHLNCSEKSKLLCELVDKHREGI